MCSKVQTLIDQDAKNLCHLPRSIGPWPQVNSELFANALAGDCAKCRKVWYEVLGVPYKGDAPIEVATKDLIKKLPGCKDVIERLLKSLFDKDGGAMNLDKILSRLPQSLWGAASFLI